MSDGFSCTQGTKRKNRPTENKGLNRQRGRGRHIHADTGYTCSDGDNVHQLTASAPPAWSRLVRQQD